MSIKARAFAGLVVALTSLAPAQAQQAAEADGALTAARPRHGPSIAVFAGARTPSRFLLIPIDLVTGQITFENAQHVSVIAGVPVARFSIPLPKKRRLDGFELGAELQALKHFSLEDSWELTGALVLRSGEIPLGKRASFNLAWGNGLSYTFDHPRLEIGLTGVRGVDTPQLLWHMSAEAEFSAASTPGYSAFLRIHHRSGIFGLIAPGWSGSNYFGVGLRYRFR